MSLRILYNPKPFFTIASSTHQRNRDPTFEDVPVLDENRWPSMEQLGLDESQYEALKLALTKEVAVIQGPPGTGKTYLGLKVKINKLFYHIYERQSVYF